MSDNYSGSETGMWFGIMAVITIVILGGILLAARGQSNSTSSTTTGTLPVVTDSDWSRGSKDAPNVLVEYADFQCPGCAIAEVTLEKLNAEHSDKVRIVFRHFPLPQHANEDIMARASEAAGIQGKFWEMHDMIYAKQADWSNSSNPQPIVEGYAQTLGLDQAKFVSDLTSATVVNRIATNKQQAADLNLPGTPSFFLNGKSIQEPNSYDAWLKLLNI